MAVYLDGCATTPVCNEAVEAAVSAMRVSYGNPSSLHKMGLCAEKILRHARETLAEALGARPGNIVFTSGATESNNLALYGLTGAYGRRGKRIVTTAGEHSSVLAPLGDLEKKGWDVIHVPIGAGMEDALTEAVDQNTLLVSFAPVNNETGAFIDARKVVAQIKRLYPDVFVHLDAAQMFGKLPIRADRWGVDLLSISGHKLEAPKGIGALFVRDKLRLEPLMRGGGQENSIRPGTQSVPLIAALGAAVSRRIPKIETDCEHYQELNRHLRQALSRISGVEINTPDDGVPYILNFSTNAVKSEIMLHYLEEHEVFVSSASACGKGAPSHVLKAMGFNAARIDTALRIGFLPQTTLEELDVFIERLKEGIRSLV